MNVSDIDRLKQNLKQKTDLLDEIYKCNDRMIRVLEDKGADFDDFDDYMSAKDELMANLDSLEEETDDILNRLNSNAVMVSGITEEDRGAIKTLTIQINGKTEAVILSEDSLKKLTAEFFAGKKKDIANTRKQSRTVRNHYRPQSSVLLQDNVIFDIKN